MSQGGRRGSSIDMTAWMRLAYDSRQLGYMYTTTTHTKNDRPDGKSMSQKALNTRRDQIHDIRHLPETGSHRGGND